jgi:glycosyltransferase involved in cell wall biosynthesis
MMQNMRIGIDISTLLNHGRDIGAGRYMINLITNLFKIDPDDTFVFTGRYVTDEYFFIIDELRSNYYDLHKIEGSKKSDGTALSVSNPEENNPEEKIQFKVFRTTQKKLDTWNSIRFPAIETRGFKADILHCPDFLIPPTFNKKIILTIHDLAFMRYPQFNFEWFVKKYSKEVRRNSRVAKKIIAVSRSTGNDIAEFLGIDRNKIEVIHEAAEESFRKIDEGELDRSLLDKFRIKDKFILSVGTIEPRKNYVTLIRAYNLLKSNHSDFRWKLVIVGRTGWLSEAAYQEYENSPYREDIIFVGRITDTELIQIYNLAEIFVYPSIFEGFGLPVVEAMQCGLAVIASNTSSIPEIVEDRELLFNPADEEDIANKMFMVLKDDRLRKELSEKAVKNAARFSWEKAAEKTLEVYKKL